MTNNIFNKTPPPHLSICVGRLCCCWTGQCNVQQLTNGLVKAGATASRCLGGHYSLYETQTGDEELILLPYCWNICINDKHHNAFRCVRQNAFFFWVVVGGTCFPPHLFPPPPSLFPHPPRTHTHSPLSLFPSFLSPPPPPH